MSKKTFTASWTIGYSCGASTGVQGGYGVTGKAKSRSLLRALQMAKKRANAMIGQAEREASEEVQDNCCCVLDDGDAHINGDLTQYWSTDWKGRPERKTRSPQLIKRILEREAKRAA